MRMRRGQLQGVAGTGRRPHILSDLGIEVTSNQNQNLAGNVEITIGSGKTPKRSTCKETTKDPIYARAWSSSSSLCNTCLAFVADSKVVCQLNHEPSALKPN